MKVLIISKKPVDTEKPMADVMRTLNMGRLFERVGWETAFVQGRRGPAPSHAGNITTIRLPDHRIIHHVQFIVRGWSSSEGIIEKETPNLIHFNHIFAMPFAVRAKRMGIPFHFDCLGIPHLEEDLSNKNVLSPSKMRLYGWMFGWVLKNASFITTVNDAHRQSIAKMTKRPVFIIRDVVDLDMMSGMSAVPDRGINDGPIILFVGAIINRRLDELFRTLGRLIAAHPNLRLVIAGDGPDLAYYRGEAERLGFGNSVAFKGYIEHSKIGALIASSDICYSDVWSNIGFPFKAFEYMACGKAVLMKGTPATREIVTDGQNGMLYGDDSELVGKTTALLKDPAMRARLGERARRDIEEHHTWRSRTDELAHILELVGPKEGRIPAGAGG